MHRDLAPALAWAIGLAAWLLAHSCAGHAHAQSDEVLTARVCVSEVAPRAAPALRVAECVQIAAATAERAVAHGRTYRAELRSYSPRATGLRPYPGREWIARLRTDRLPEVHGVDREAMRWRFAALVSVAWRAVRGIDRAPCEGALEWGARGCARCRERMRAAGYRRAGCGLSNAWWRR